MSEMILSVSAEQDVIAVARSSPTRAIPAWLPEKWQSIVDTIAELANVPVGLVMRVVGDDIEVLVSSRTVGNPYKPGDAMRLPNSGLYCEEVIRSGGALNVANALLDAMWRENPDIELGMISYLGVPICWPDANPFGTLCILDEKERSHSDVVEKLLAQFRDIIEHHLSLIHNDAERELSVEADRRRYSEDLRSSEQRFRFLVEHAAEDFILHDCQGRILDANQQACRNSGMTREALRSSTIKDLPFRLGDAWTEAIWLNAKPSDAETIEASYVLPGGQLAPVEIRWSCQLMQGEKLFLILSRDISERQRAEEALRAAEAELARASRLNMMGQLASSIVHETNQPLSALVTHAAACLLWLDRAEPQIEEARESARLLSQSARDVSEIVSGLRAVAQKSAPTRVALDVNHAVDDALLLTRRECSQSGVERTVKLCEGSAIVMGDRTQIKQVVLNLILNASEAMRDIGERERLLTVSTRRAEGGKILIVVEDSGAGLTGHAPDRLFEPMFTTKKSGMGMGLAICRSIVEAHAGTIWAEERAEGPGARFCISLPAA